MTKNREHIFNKYSGLCAYTGKPLGNDWQIDHVYPKRRGLYDDISNLIPTLKIVNHYKRARDLESFRLYMMTFHERLGKLPKSTRLERTKNSRIEYMWKIADAFGIRPDKPFTGKFYFETIN